LCLKGTTQEKPRNGKGEKDMKKQETLKKIYGILNAANEITEETERVVGDIVSEYNLKNDYVDEIAMGETEGEDGYVNGFYVEDETFLYTE
jgi:hypothetical protein